MLTVQKLQRPTSTFPEVRGWAKDQFTKGASSIALEFALSKLSFANDLADCVNVDLSLFPAAATRERWHQCWQSSPLFWTYCTQELETTETLEASAHSDDDPATSIAELLKELLPLPSTVLPVSRRRAIGRWVAVRIRHSQRTLLDHIDELMAGVPPEDASHAPLDQNDALLFLAKIYCPALAHFGLPPEILFREATAGDYQSLERVIALDPTMESHSEIREALWNRVRNRQPSPILSGRMTTIRRIGWKRKSAKAQVMAWIRDSARLMASAVTDSLRQASQRGFGLNVCPGRVFTVPDLQRLFDAYARDLTGHVDQDLTGSAETLKKMVDRCSKSFPVSHWDIFSKLNVPVK